MSSVSKTVGVRTERIDTIECPHCQADLDVSDSPAFSNMICPTCDKVFMVPAKLGEFILLRLVGVGSMGCVFLARDYFLNRFVALKVLNERVHSGTDEYTALQQEAQAMAALNHPNVVGVHHFGRTDWQDYVVMEWIGGERIDEIMNKGKIPEADTLRIDIDVAEGLNAAQAVGLIHGDIKPSNIMMTQKNRAKVVDFGLASFSGDGRPPKGDVWGTPFYVAPEKIEKKWEDARSDQYSLGVTLYHMLSGSPPFDANDSRKVVKAVKEDPTPDLRGVVPELSSRTCKIVRKMMDKEPGERFGDYTALIRELQKALKVAEKRERKSGVTSWFVTHVANQQAAAM